MSNVKENVLAELRAKHVKLWLPPYYDHGNPDQAALNELAGKLAKEENTQGSQEEILTSLRFLQAHALEKLEKKKKSTAGSRARLERLEIKVLGLRSHLEEESITSSPAAVAWAERMEVTSRAITLYSVNPTLTVAKFFEDLQELLQVDAVRIVHKGKSISLQNRDAQVCDVLLQSGASPSGTSVLCLVSYQDNVAAANPSPDQTLISSLRRAAAKLQSGGATNFEVTDQHGKHVSMHPAERLAFLTALGLHRLGRKRLDDGDMSSALVFLLEADYEWNNNISSQWYEKVDNFGLLQLDIAWVYLKLESLDSLPDVTKRLKAAETVLRKQVHTNFVTLALAQADMGNPVPPLAAVFCRLFLLQGVAYCHGHQQKESKEKLDGAWQLCQSLRSVSTAGQVAALCEAVGVSEFQAISALRRTNGNSDQAVALMEQDEMDALRQRQRRELQDKLGLCTNTVDHVDLDLVPKVQSVLGLSSTAALPIQEDGLQEMDSNFLVAAGLLRLADNDLGTAIDLYQDMQRNPFTVRERVAALDQSLYEQGITKKKRSRREVNDQPVDDVALTTLVSMGVDESTAKKALRRSQNNVDMALLWLCNQSNSSEQDGRGSVDESEASSKRSRVRAKQDSESEKVDSGDSESKESAAKKEELEMEQAEELLERELGEALNERDIEKDYLGSSLDEEWGFLEKYRASD